MTVSAPYGRPMRCVEELRMLDQLMMNNTGIVLMDDAKLAGLMRNELTRTTYPMVNLQDD